MENNLIKIESNPQSLIALAIEKGADIEHLEKLMALKERYDAIEANKAFLSALSTFQRDVPVIEKKKLVNYPSKTGGFVNYKYAELPEIDEAIKVPMASNGFSKRWEFKEEAEKLICTCIISHVDGHQEKTTMSSIKDASGGKNEIQSRASANTYMQRYTLIGALGLTTASEDNDADGTPDATKPKQATNQASYQEDTREWLSEARYKDAINRINRGEQGVLNQLNIEFKMKKPYRLDLELATANPKKPLPVLKEKTPAFISAHQKLHTCEITMEDIEARFTVSKEMRDKLLLKPTI